MHVNHEGHVITLEGMARIEQRLNRKEQRKAEMQAERATQYGQRHSHVGVEIGRALGSLENQSHVYSVLAALANWCAMTPDVQEQAGQTLTSLANGVARACHEFYGAEGLAQLQDYAATQPSRLEQLPKLPMEPEGELRFGPTPEGDYLAVGANEPMTEAMRQIIRDAGFDPDDPNAPKVQMHGQGLASIADPDEHEEWDATGSDEPSVSPEPADTPQRRAAATRRANKLAAQRAQMESNAAEQGTETSED